MAFRFFINVDQCLNMNFFDFFFYRRRSEHKLYIVPDVYIGEGTGRSFRKAAGEVRLYLDRFPYHVGDYQIIIAMRSNYSHESRVWEDTLLSRLLHIDSDLKHANIFTRSGNRVQVVVNLIMLYEAGQMKNLHSLDDNYMDSNRLMDDCRLLMRKIGVTEGKENDLEELRRAWNVYKSTQYSDSTKEDEDVIAAFFSNLLSQYEADQQEKKDDNNPECISVTTALREVLAGYQIFEAFGDRQNRDIEMNSLLRIVEFSVRDFVIPMGMENTVTLSELCKSHWESISKISDADIKSQYSQMLYEYRARLQDYVAEEEDGAGSHETGTLLPAFEKPGDNDISVENMFETKDGCEKVTMNPKQMIKEFREHLMPVSTMLGRWESVSGSIKESLKNLGSNLAEYSDSLGRIYKENLEKRKNEEESWHNKNYIADKDTETDIKQLTEMEKNILVSMGDPQMTPSLRFQDQLNMETALEKNSAEIVHYIRCMQSVSGKNFILLILMLVGMAAFHFAILQPYDFNEWMSTVYYFAYLGICAVLMLFTWLMPISHYKKKVDNSLTVLEKEMDNYISGYFDRAEQLKMYINRVNQLDYLERHLRLKKRAVVTSEWLTAAHRWHLSQAKNHLKKLEFFSGLIGLYHPDNSQPVKPSNGMNMNPVITVQHVDDVFENRLYWPQK